MSERAFTFSCKGAELLGVIHDAEPGGTGDGATGLLIVVGGDQYRVGAHRQYVTLARRMARAGFPAMRFDDRGKGDAEGAHVTYEEVQHDAAAALAAFHAQCPGLERVVLWGLCGAVTTFLLAARLPDSVAGLVLVNPWVRTDEGVARAILKHYYWERLVSPDLWRKIARGDFSFGQSLRSLAGSIARVLPGRGQTRGAEADLPLPEQMARGLQAFDGPALIVLSGRDLTAQEFEEEAARSTLWRSLLASDRVTVKKNAAADHTFSRRAWQAELESWTLDWVGTLKDRP